MARAAPKACPSPGCPHLVYDGGSYCEDHRKDTSRERHKHRYNSSNRAVQDFNQFYRTQAWVKLRNWFIKRNPYCARCYESGVVTPGRVVDHIIERKDDSSLSLDPNNLQTLCQACHSLKTQEERVRRQNDPTRK